MIQTELIMIDGRQLRRTWSDAGFMIERDGAVYSEAVDPIDSGRLYEETTIPLEEEEATIDDYQKALSELGVSV